MQTFLKIALISLLTVCFWQCDEGLNLSKNKTEKVSGRWDYGAGNNNPGSFRNKHYTFDLNNSDDTLNISLESAETNVSLWVYDPLGQLIRQVWGGRVENILILNPEAGEYKVIAGTNARGEKGNFDLKIKGNISNFGEITSETQQLQDNWKTLGGGNNHPFSPRNHRFTVEILENNSNIDVVLESKNTNTSLWVYNHLGELIRQVWGGRTEFISSGTDKGIYTIVAGTNVRNTRDAGYTLNVNGQFSNLKKEATQDTIVTATIVETNRGGYQDSPANQKYTFEVSENNSWLDIIMESPNYDVSFWLLDPLGRVIDSEWGGRSEFSVRNVQSGVHTIVAGTTRNNSSGAFSLSLTGNFKNFKKQ